MDKYLIEHLIDRTQKRYESIALRVVKPNDERGLLKKQLDMEYASDMIQMLNAIKNDEYELAEELAERSKLKWNNVEVNDEM